MDIYAKTGWLVVGFKGYRIYSICNNVFQQLKTNKKMKSKRLKPLIRKEDVHGLELTKDPSSTNP